MTWVVKEAFLDYPKVAARVERARSRGHEVEIDPSPPSRHIFIGGKPPIAGGKPEEREEDEG
jgi:hypothetical protein